MNAKEIRKQAELEVLHEKFRREVECEKDRLRRAMAMPWWKRLISFANPWKK